MNHGSRHDPHAHRAGEEHLPRMEASGPRWTSVHGQQCHALNRPEDDRWVYCHTPLRESGNEASIRVPGCSNYTYSNNMINRVIISFIMTRGSKEIHHCNEKLSVAWTFTGIDRWIGPPNNHFRDQDENLDSTPRVHLNNNAGKLSRLMVATRKYGAKYDMETNSKEG
jgi:hypothetical protein